MEWSQEAETLMKKCTTAPVLAYANYTLPFNACGSGLGAVLYQVQEGKTESYHLY